MVFQSLVLVHVRQPLSDDDSRHRSENRQCMSQLGLDRITRGREMFGRQATVPT